MPEKITSKKLTELLKVCRGHTADMDASSGQITSAIRAAVEKHGLNRSVFSLIRRLDRMPVEKLAIFLEDLEHYIVSSGVKRKAESAPSFEETRPAAVEDDETKDATVVSINKARKPRSKRQQADAAE